MSQLHTNKKVATVHTTDPEAAEKLEALARETGARYIGVPVSFQGKYSQTEIDLALKFFTEIMGEFIAAGPEGDLYPPNVAACLLEVMMAVDEQVKHMPEEGEEKTDASTEG